MLQYARTRKHKRADSGRSSQVFLFPYPSRYGRLHRTPSCMHCIRLPFACMHLRKSKRKSHQRENPKDHSCTHGTQWLFRRGRGLVNIKESRIQSQGDKEEVIESRTLCTKPDMLSFRLSILSFRQALHHFDT